MRRHRSTPSVPGASWRNSVTRLSAYAMPYSGMPATAGAAIQIPSSTATTASIGGRVSGSHQKLSDSPHE